LIKIRSGGWRRIAAIGLSGLAVTMTMWAATPASASIPPEGGGGGSGCQGAVYEYASGGRVYFQGWVPSCYAPPPYTSYSIKLSYDQSNGSTHYANLKTCSGTIAQQEHCGLTWFAGGGGGSFSLADPSGTQTWCANILVIVPTRTGSDGQWWPAGPSCITH
jgi:hypothetical protein